MDIEKIRKIADSEKVKYGKQALIIMAVDIEKQELACGFYGTSYDLSKLICCHICKSEELLAVFKNAVYNAEVIRDKAIEECNKKDKKLQN